MFLMESRLEKEMGRNQNVLTVKSSNLMLYNTNILKVATLDWYLSAGLVHSNVKFSLLQY